MKEVPKKISSESYEILWFRKNFICFEIKCSNENEIIWYSKQELDIFLANVDLLTFSPQLDCNEIIPFPLQACFAQFISSDL